MTGAWLVSYLVLWLLAVGQGLMILALAREIQDMRARLEAHEQHLRLLDLQAMGAGDGKGHPGEALSSVEELTIPLRSQPSRVGEADD